MNGLIRAAKYSIIQPRIVRFYFSTHTEIVSSGNTKLMGKQNDSLYTTHINLNTKVPPERISLIDRMTKLSNSLMTLFLPKGFPDSVYPEYNRYAFFNCLGMLFSTITGVLSTHSLLFALGIGNSALPFAAGLNWIIKDGIGQFGGILFTSLINIHLDSNSKSWRLYTDFILQASTFIETLTVTFPQLFLPIAALANIGKNMSWLIGGGTRASLHNALCKNSNLGDVTSKTGSQVTASTVIGTVVGVILCSLSTHTLFSFYLMYFPFAILHISCIYMSIKKIPIRTLNHFRADVIVGRYLESSKVMTPEETTHYDPIAFPFAHYKKNSILMNKPLSLSYFTIDQLYQQMMLTQLNYMISVDRAQHHLIIYSLQSTSNEDVFKAHLHGNIISHEMKKNNISPTYDNINQLIISTIDTVQSRFPDYHSQLFENGWQLKHQFLEFNEMKIQFLNF